MSHRPVPPPPDPRARATLQPPCADERPTPRPLSAYPLRARDTVRLGDLDKMGHVNNAVFATFFETGRASFMIDPQRTLAPKGASFVLARLVIDFRAEVCWPGHVDIGSRIEAVGRSSVRLAQALFQGETCAATAETTVVLIDLATRRPTPLPDETVEILHASMDALGA